MKKHVRKWVYQTVLRLATTGAAVPQRHYRLVILKLDKLGDAVLSLGAVRRLLLEYGDEHTLLIVSSIAEPLFRAEFPGVQRLVLPAFCQNFAPDFLRFLLHHSRELRRLSADVLVCLRHVPSDYLHAISCLMNVRKCFASRWEQPWENISLAYPAVTFSPYPRQGGGTCQELEAHRRLLETVTGKDILLEELMPVMTSIQPSDGHALLVCPEAGDPMRQYPPALLAEALRSFLERLPIPVEFCLPQGSDVRPWREYLAKANVLCDVWHQPEDFMSLMRLVAGAGMVLAPESAPAHLAAALDKPGVFLLGGGHFGLLAPWCKSARQHWLHHLMECYHCRWQCPYLETLCLTHIPAQTVAQSLWEASLQAPGLRSTTKAM